VDLRTWFVRNELPKASELDPLVKHIPRSDYRTDNIIRLFLAGRQTGFLLTDAAGQPTESLRLMVSLMAGAVPGESDPALCCLRDLTEAEQRAFQKEDLGDQNWWCIRNITARVKWARIDLQYNYWPWVHHFLPGLDGAYLRSRDPDGKRHRRVCYIAVCPTRWEMTQRVYEGLWRWNFEHRGDWDGYKYRPAKCPDGYGILDRYLSDGPGCGSGEGECSPDATGSAPHAALPPLEQAALQCEGYRAFGA
jgi:hypothetical protein